MTFNWRGFLTLAIELEESADEAKLRSSISRAYYASYCSARDYMDKKIPKNVPPHKYVIEYYNGFHGGKTNFRRSLIAENLKLMKVKRVTSDYDNKSQNIKSMRESAQFVLDLSKDVIEFIEDGGL